MNPGTSDDNIVDLMAAKTGLGKIDILFTQPQPETAGLAGGPCCSIGSSRTQHRFDPLNIDIFSKLDSF